MFHSCLAKGEFFFMSKKSTYKFKFSIVSAVYNVEKYIGETIESIINQDIGFEDNVQLILVDDCSKDKSFEICRSYAEKFPKNIIAVQLPKNSGNASTPRNTAMQYVEGKYINCTDSDDILTTNTLSLVWDFFEEHESETDMVAIPIDMFYNNDITNIVHTKRNTFIGDKSRVIDLNDNWKCTISSVATVFCHARNKDFYEFDPTIINGEDLMVANKILLQKKTLGLLAGCTYLYRQHVKTDAQESLIQQGQKKTSWYTHSIKYITKRMLDYALEKEKSVPRFYQFALACDLQWRMIVRHKAEKLLPKEELEEFYTLLIEQLSRFDFGIIMALPNLPITEKIYVLRKKYILRGQAASIVDSNLFSSFPPTIHLYDLKQYDDGTVEIFFDYNDILYENTYEVVPSFDVPAKIEVIASGHNIVNYYKKDEILLVKKMFSLRINKENIPHYSTLTFSFKRGNEIIKTALVPTGRFPITPDYSGSYIFIDKFVVSLRKNAIKFDKFCNCVI